MAFTHDFPVELASEILRYLEPKELTAIARTSSILQLEAESLLYHHVDLTHPKLDLAQLLRWSITIAADQRRAHHVNTLKFPSGLAGGPDGQVDAGTHEIIANAFMVIINLKHLFLMEVGNQSLASIGPTTLCQCSFRLTSFAGNTPSFDVDSTWDFIAGQPDLEYWIPTQPFLISCETFPEGILPRLRQTLLVEDKKVRLLRGRPVEALALVSLDPVYRMSSGIEVITGLNSLSSTLHTLVHIHSNLSDEWTAADEILKIAENAPMLVSLTLTSFGRFSGTTAVSEQPKLLSAVSRLRRLKLLIINTVMDSVYLGSNEDPDFSNPRELDEERWAKYGMHPAQCRKVASSFMAVCMSLQTFSFPSRYSDDKKTEEAISLTYLRSMPDGSAVFDGFYAPDTSGWWMP